MSAWKTAKRKLPESNTVLLFKGPVPQADSDGSVLILLTLTSTFMDSSEAHLL